MRKWLPNADLRRPDVWSDISNAIPTVQGTYRNAPGFLGSGTNPSTPGTILTAWQGLTVDGTATKLAGTTTKLFTWSGTTFTDRSKGGGYTSTATAWSFVQYGNITIATNYLDAVQSRDATGAAAFADLAGTPPKAAIAVVQSNAVVLFNYNDGVNAYRDGWAASDTEDYTVWTPSSASDSARGRILIRPGPITAAIAFRDFIVVFKESSCFAMRYTDPPVYWRVDLLSDAHGALAQGAVCSTGDSIIVCDYKNGAYEFDGGGFRRLDEGFRSYLTQVVLTPNASQFFRSQGSVWFNTPTQAVLAYNIKSDAWGKFTAAVPDYQTLAGAHVLMTGSGIHDAMRGATMIDPVATNIPILSSFQEDEAAGTQNTALDGYVTTGYVGKAGETTQVSRITPQFKIPDSVISMTNVPAYTALSMTPYSVGTPEGTATAGSAVSASATEKRFDYLKTASWHKFKISFTDTPWEIDDVIVTQQDAGEP